MKLALVTLLCLAGCSKASGVAENQASGSPATDPGAATVVRSAAPAAAAAASVTCRSFIDHMVALQDAEKKEGIINRSNATSMTARCEKANNLGSSSDAATCVMNAKDVATMSACKNMGKLLGPW